MQYQGYSTKNLHQGDVRITGDLQVDGSVDINDLTINNLTVDNIDAKNITVDELKIDGYTLPTTKGNEGDIIVATGDGSTSEWKEAFEGTARVVVNKFTALGTNQNDDFGNWRVIENASVGTKNFTQSEWTINSEIRIKVVGYWNYQRADFTIIPTGKFGIRLNNAGLPQELYDVEATNTYAGVTFPQTVSTQGYFSLDVSLIRLNENQYNWRANLINSKQISNQFTAVGILTPEKLGVHPVTFGGAVADPFTVSIEWQDNTNQGSGLSYLRPFINRYEIDLVSASSTILATSANLTTDHTLLSNLTLSDAGHTQFALLQGRDGGQVLSGGITPLHDLKLKSHSIGLDNVIIKDLNTEFKKDVDMDNNNIINANIISNTDGSIQYNTPSYGLEITTQNSKSLNVVSALDAKLTATNVLDISAGSLMNFYNGIATQMTIDGSEIGANIPLNMNSNNIINAKDIVDASTSNRIDMNTGGFLNSLELSSADEVKLLNTVSNNFISSSGAGLNITGNLGNLDISSVNAGNTIAMNDGTLLGGLSIKSNNVGVLIQENSSTNNLGVTSGSVGMVCNSGQLNIRSTDGANDLSIVKQNGGNINLDSAGLVIVNNSNLDMNNNSIINTNNLGVVSINNLTPAGGLSSGTSNSATLSGSTAEQSILALSFVGSRQAPANTFKQGDAYTAVLAGTFGSNNGDTLTLRLKGGATGTTILSSVVVPLNGSSGQFYELEIDFVVRQIGAAGIADLAINYDFSYNQAVGGNFQGQRKCEFNNTTFDTTILNTLDITAQFSSTSGNNSITTILSTLGKTY